jgi:osmoprotectant transport system ATP-binding protein
MIRLEHVCKSYDGGRRFAVEDVELTVEQGELLVLLGESGCGKTTTLKMINRLVEPSGGRILIEGRDAAGVDPVELRRRIGYVFQGVGLFPHMCVADNVAVVPRLLGWQREAIDARVDELLALTGLEPREYRDRSPARLSGGEQQRVGLARALAARPGIMLMDEPLGALDPLTRNVLQQEFRRIHRDLGLTTVMVTHDIIEALLMADRLAVMQEGRVAAIGTPHELLGCEGNDYVAELMAMPKRQSDEVERLIARGTER